MAFPGFVIYVTLTLSASCISVSFLSSSSTENDIKFSLSFQFRAENKLPFSALVSFSAENTKPSFGRSLMPTNLLNPLVREIESNPESVSGIKFVTKCQACRRCSDR